jgi:hypothetical protein
LLLVRAPRARRTRATHARTAARWNTGGPVQPFHKETFMKKFAFALLLVGMFGLAISGCRAEGEIDSSAAVVAPR